MTPRHVYAVPVEFNIRASLFILASSPEEAAREASKVTLTDTYSFDDEQFWAEQGERMKIEDVTNERLIEGEAPKAVPTDEYPASSHPDHDM